MAVVAAMFDARRHQFSENYISEVQTDAGVLWATSVPVPSFGIKKSKKYSLGQYITRDEARTAVKKFLKKSAAYAQQSRQLSAGNGICFEIITQMVLRCKNLALKMQNKSLKARLAAQKAASKKKHPAQTAKLEHSQSDQNVTGRTQLREERRKAVEEGRHWAAAGIDVAILEAAK